MIFGKKVREEPKPPPPTPTDPETYGEGLLIKTCRTLELMLIKEHFANESRYIVKYDDENSYTSEWCSPRLEGNMAYFATKAILEWAKENRVGITTEVLVP